MGEVFIRGIAAEHSERFCWQPGYHWCQQCMDELARLAADFWAIWEAENGRAREG